MKCNCIAVLENSQNTLATFETCTHLALWNRENGPDSTWSAGECVPFTLSGCAELAPMRERLRQLAATLHDVTAIAGLSISGLAYNELGRLGFCLCELDAFSPDILEALAQEIMASEQDASQVPAEPVPGETPGTYRINLMEVLAAHPDISSKKALRPFLASTPFVELEIICGHMPPWLEEHVRRNHLTCARTRQTDGTVVVRISHALCHETTPVD